MPEECRKYAGSVNRGSDFSLLGHTRNVPTILKPCASTTTYTTMKIAARSPTPFFLSLLVVLALAPRTFGSPFPSCETRGVNQSPAELSVSCSQKFNNVKKGRRETVFATCPSGTRKLSQHSCQIIGNKRRRFSIVGEETLVDLRDGEKFGLACTMKANKFFRHDATLRASIRCLDETLCEAESQTCESSVDCCPGLFCNTIRAPFSFDVISKTCAPNKCIRQGSACKKDKGCCPGLQCLRDSSDKRRSQCRVPDGDDSPTGQPTFSPLPSN